MTASPTIGARIAQARSASGLAQRDLERETGISQTTLCRIENGTREPKMNEVLAIAWATGSTISELTGHSPVRDRVQCAARASDEASMDTIRRELTHYLELDAYLEAQAIPQPA